MANINIQDNEICFACEYTNIFNQKHNAPITFAECKTAALDIVGQKEFNKMTTESIINLAKEYYN